MSRRASLAGALRRGIFPHQVSWLLELPLRKLLVSPRVLADRADLTPSSSVLELGPGSGFFSKELARRVAKGRIELLDVQFEMLRKARRKLRGFQHIGYAVGDGSAPLPYAFASFDVVILVSVLGEVPDAASCLRALCDVLRPQGRILCHETIVDPDMIRLPALLELARAADLILDKRWGTTWNYTVSLRVVS